MNRQPPGYEPDELPTAPPRAILVERAGFEPAKALPADLQSAPFGQLGYLSSYYIMMPACRQLLQEDLSLHTGADDRTRTGNLLITNQLLCQLSYVGRPTAYFIIPTSPAEVKMGNFPGPYILSLLSRYLSSFLFTLCRALSTDLTCLFKSEAISW